MSDFSFFEDESTYDDDLYNFLLELWVDEFDSPDLRNFRFLITAPYMMYKIETFRRFFEDHLQSTLIVAKVDERLSEYELAQYNGQYDIALTGDDRFTRQIIKNSGVKAICKWGTGIDSIDSEACREFGVQLYNTPGAFTRPVSQSILATILGFCRQTFYSDLIMKVSKKWVKVPGKTLEEISIGIVGFGNIGQEVARLVRGIGGHVGIYDILTFNPELTEHVHVYSTLDELLENSDIVCLCTTYNPTSHHLINFETIWQMKEGSYLINMARGSLVDENALIQALHSGHLAGAALDVFENEPLAVDSPLRGMANVILSSHNSNSSKLYWNKVHLNTVRNAIKCTLNS